jgi:uncharacterized protein YijF (DUF1287 family)
MTRRLTFTLAALILFSMFACQQLAGPATARRPSDAQLRPLPDNAPAALKQVVQGAMEQPDQTFYYDPAYVKIEYPGGDVPLERGVCTDVVIRAFRKAGTDLQKQVHEDMKSSFGKYPTKWGLSKPDTNIDHRRVPNLRTYFTRMRKEVPVTSSAQDYKPGDVVSWDLGTGVDHIGIVTNMWSQTANSYLIVHNIGGGARIENVLFSWQITGHYRYF